jgi:hypothetical protein
MEGGKPCGSCKAVPYYNTNTLKGGLQLAATVTQGPTGTHRDPQGPTGTHREVVPRGHKEETDGGQEGGGRYRKQAAAEAAAVS